MSAQSDWESRQEFAREVGVGVHTVIRWGEQGVGPQPHRLSPRIVRYRRSEVAEWLSSTRETA